MTTATTRRHTTNAATITPVAPCPTRCDGMRGGIASTPAYDVAVRLGWERRYLLTACEEFARAERATSLAVCEAALADAYHYVVLAIEQDAGDHRIDTLLREQYGYVGKRLVAWVASRASRWVKDATCA
jgi:hypothetical protein